MTTCHSGAGDLNVDCTRLNNAPESRSYCFNCKQVKFSNSKYNETWILLTNCFKIELGVITCFGHFYNLLFELVLSIISFWGWLGWAARKVLITEWVGTFLMSMKKSERNGELSMTKHIFHSKGGKLVRPDKKWQHIR